MSPGLRDDLNDLPFCQREEDDGGGFTDASAGAGELDVTLPCNAIAMYLSIYRICFIVTLYFMAMSLAMIGVKSSSDPRAGIQNGFWAIKFLIIIGGMIGAFYIPARKFDEVWMWFGMIGGFLFIIIQVILIINFAHSWAESWLGKYEETESKVWMAALLTVTFTCYGVSLAAVVLFYYYYIGEYSGQCKLLHLRCLAPFVGGFASNLMGLIWGGEKNTRILENAQA